MKKTILGALAFAMLSTPTFADFTNGSFETGDLSGWSYRWGTTSGSGTVGKFDPANPGLWEKDVTWTGSVNWFGEPDKGTPSTVTAAVVTEAEGYNRYKKAFSQTFDGTRQLLINTSPTPSGELFHGSRHVTSFAQKAEVFPADIQNGKYTVYLGWSAFLENPESPVHLTHEQPGVIIMLGIKPAGETDWTYTQEFHSGDEQDSEGWEATPFNRGVDAFARRTKFQKEVHLGDSVSISVTLIDCALGAHGAFAFIDQAGFKDVDTTTVDSTVIAAPCIYGSDSVLFGSRVKVNGDFGSGKGILFEADAIDTGKGWAAGSVYMRDRSSIVGDLTYNTSLVKWNNTSISGTATQNTKFVFPALQAKAFVPGSTDVNAYWGQTVNVVPGSYNSLNGYGGSILLTAGTYNLRSFNMYEGNGKLILDNSNGPIYINIAGDFQKHNVKDSVILSGSDYINSGVYYHVTGNLNIYSGKNHVWGSFDVPNGTATLDSREIGGYVHAKRVVINSDAKSTCREALPLP